MLISLDWLGDFLDVPDALDVRELMHELTLRTVEVEGSAEHRCDLGEARVARILDVGRGEARVELDGRDHVAAFGVTAGFAVGDLVAVRPAAGSTSQRLLTPADLGLEAYVATADADRVLVISDVGATVGMALSELVAERDLVIEIDNKSLTNRPDLWSHKGIAREFGAIFGLELRELPRRPPDPALAVTHLCGEIDPALCHQLTLTAIERSDALPPTPIGMRTRLARTGQRTLGLYPDLTNYVVLAVGQPSHVYDASKISLPLSVRRAHDADASHLSFLHGQPLALDIDTPVIADADGPVAVAGVVGGVPSQTTPSTTEIVLEAGRFDKDETRVIVLKHGARTEAAVRFEKGADSARLLEGRDYLLHLMSQIDVAARVTGFQIAGSTTTSRSEIDTTLDFLNARLGTSIDATDVRRLIGPLGFDVSEIGPRLSILAPVWRSTGDVSIQQDIVEEVGRMIGYDNLPASSPTITLRIPDAGGQLLVERRIREFLATRVQAQEVLTYPWSAKNQLEARGWATDDLLRFEGAPSPDRRWLRPSLVPNLVELAQLNRRHADCFRLFELGSVFRPQPRRDDDLEPLPAMPRYVAAIFVGSSVEEEFRSASGAVAGIVRASWCEKPIELVSVDVEGLPGLDIVIDGATVGAVRSLPVDVLSSATGPAVGATIELAIEPLEPTRSRPANYRAIAQYPETSIDISVVLDNAVLWQNVVETVENVDPLIRAVCFVDEYRGPGVPDRHRSLTLRLRLGSDHATLEASDGTVVREKAVAALGAAFKATVRGG